MIRFKVQGNLTPVYYYEILFFFKVTFFFLNSIYANISDVFDLFMLDFFESCLKPFIGLYYY